MSNHVVSYRFVPTALLIGNFVIGTSVVAPTGILNELSAGLNVSIREASYLIAFGSAVLCVVSPLILTLLAITAIFACAQFMILTFVAPLLVLLGKTDADGISLAIALYGLAGSPAASSRRASLVRPDRS